LTPFVAEGMHAQVCELLEILLKDTDADLLDMIQDLGATMEEQEQTQPQPQSQETAAPILDPVASAASGPTPMEGVTR
jgi:hypothetical protein